MSGTTPGPWRVSTANPTKTRGLDILGGYSKTVASVPVPQYVKSTADADARLIAAAPDLLEALEAIRAGYPTNSNAFKIADQAIAKARGAA